MIAKPTALLFTVIVLLGASYASGSAKTLQELGDEYNENIRVAAGTQDWTLCGGPPYDDGVGARINIGLINSIVCLAKSKPDLALDLIRGVEGRLLGLDTSNLSTDQLGTLIVIEQSASAALDKVRFLAQRVIIPTIVDNSSSPVTLKSCVERHKLDDPQWVITASWRARSQNVSAIKLHVETDNAFGDVLQSDDLTPTGDFTSDEDSQDVWTIGDYHMPPYVNVARVRCSITSAILSDGSVWKAAAAAPSPAASKSSHPRRTTP